MEVFFRLIMQSNKLFIIGFFQMNLMFEAELIRSIKAKKEFDFEL